MMRGIDVRRCNAEKNYAGELVFEFAGEEELLDIPYVAFSSPVEAKLHYEILEDDSVEVRGTVSFSLKGECSRCLKMTERRFTGEAEGYFVPRGAKGAEEDYSYSNGVIDLGEFLRDAVLFAMPARLTCSDGCTAPDYKAD